MATIIYLVSFLVIPFLCVSMEESVPVLLWRSTAGHDVQQDSTALSKLDRDQFENALLQNVASDNPLILLATEENLSSEDFVRSDLSASGSFPKLTTLSESSSHFLLYPSVESPVQAVKRLVKHGYAWKAYSKGLYPEEPTVLALNLDDIKEDESRDEMLRRHDTRVAAIYADLVKHAKKVMVIYTGQFSSWSMAEARHRVRRLLADPPSNTTSNGTLIVDSGNRAMIYTLFPPSLNISLSVSSYDKLLNLTNPTAVTFDETKETQKLSVTFSSPQKTMVRFMFTTRKGYWSLRDIQVTLPNNTEMLLTVKSTITAPNNFSYNCGTEKTVFRNGSVSLTFRHLQVQPYMWKQKAIFSNAYDCLYFFSMPILSGIFVTLFLAAILSWGICMILDIKTMDRFDDPKGKTISINASD